MYCKVEACAECTHKCLLLHGKGKSSTPFVCSFFKVMIGNNFSNILFFPPKLAPMVSVLIDQETFLEDSSGKQWKVKITNLKDSFALQQGWNAFVSDHELEIGDFVVFNYIVGSHFVVQIYDKSGCEKLDFSVSGNQKKRSQSNRNFTGKDGPCHTIDEGSMSKRGSSTSVVSVSDVDISQGQCKVKDVEKVKTSIKSTSNNKNVICTSQGVSKANLIEEPFHMINRDFIDKEGEHQGSIFDLSVLEMLRNNSGNDGRNKLTVGDEKGHHADASLMSKNDAGLGKSPGKGWQSRLVSLDESNFDVSVAKNYSEEKDKLVAGCIKNSRNDKITGHPLIKSRLQMVKGSENSMDLSDRVLKRWQTVEGIGEGIDKAQPRREKKGIKMEPGQSSNLPVAGHNRVNGVMKPETIDKSVYPLSSAPNVSCLMSADSQTFLELPAPLSPISYKGGMRSQMKLVYLRDPDMRVWPVVYHGTYGLKTLAGGWEAFRTANNIQPGDKCIFQAEIGTEDIFRVFIVHKKIGQHLS